jgi:hypothetical protein
LVTDIEAERYCLACRQSLRGVVSRTCPECGRDFDPADPRTTSPHAHSGAVRFMRDASHAAIVASGLVAALALVHSATAYRLAPFFGPMAFWLCGLPLAPVFALLVVLSAWRVVSGRMRVLGVLFPVVFASIALTNWPLYLNVALHRPFLNAIADQVQASGVSRGSGATGLFRYRQVRAISNGNVGFQLSGGAGGGIYLVRVAAGQPLPGARIWHNTNWEVSVGARWHVVYED